MTIALLFKTLHLYKFLNNLVMLLENNLNLYQNLGINKVPYMLATV